MQDLICPFGGLLGLQRITGTEAQTVADIAALIDMAISEFACIDAIPCESLCGYIVNYKLSRRSRR
jgi:hypothetical protein